MKEARCASMDELITIGLDIAKSAFQVTGRWRRSGSDPQVRQPGEHTADFRKSGAVHRVLSGAHYWGSRAAAQQKRCERRGGDAAYSALMAVKTPEQRAALMLPRPASTGASAHLSNAIRAHLAELGIVSARAAIGRVSCSRSLRLMPWPDSLGGATSQGF
jgi:hypothetical protein